MRSSHGTVYWEHEKFVHGLLRAWEIHAMRNCAMRGIDNYINILFQINQAIDAVC